MSRILLVVAPYYTDITDGLIAGATRVLADDSSSHEMLEVPGAFEIPGAIRLAAETNRYDGYIALGCVIRGETTHYDYICGESARGLMDLTLQQQLAIGNGILTVENKAQALARADINGKDKGGEAARACLTMLQLKQRFANA